jgi:hypothetical protein
VPKLEARATSKRGREEGTKHATVDVKVVQGGLNRIIGPAAAPRRLNTNGLFDQELEQAIIAFQRVALGAGAPDGRVDPGGRSYRALADQLNFKRIMVNLKDQWLEALEDGRRVYSFPCVTGDGAHPTNKGTFRVLRMRDKYTSKAYGRT